MISSVAKCSWATVIVAALPAVADLAQRGEHDVAQRGVERTGGEHAIERGVAGRGVEAHQRGDELVGGVGLGQRRGLDDRRLGDHVCGLAGRPAALDQLAHPARALLVLAAVDAVAGRRAGRSQNSVATLPRTQRLRRDPDAAGQLTDAHSNNWSGVVHPRHCKRFHKSSAKLCNDSVQWARAKTQVLCTIGPAQTCAIRRGSQPPTGCSRLPLMPPQWRCCAIPRLPTTSCRTSSARCGRGPRSTGRSAARSPRSCRSWRGAARSTGCARAPPRAAALDRDAQEARYRPAAAEPPSEEVIRRDSAQAMLRDLDGLPDGQRAAVLLHHIGGLSDGELARAPCTSRSEPPRAASGSARVAPAPSCSSASPPERTVIMARVLVMREYRSAPAGARGRGVARAGRAGQRGSGRTGPARLPPGADAGVRSSRRDRPRVRGGGGRSTCPRVRAGRAGAGRPRGRLPRRLPRGRRVDPRARIRSPDCRIASRSRASGWPRRFAPSESTRASAAWTASSAPATSPSRARGA